jgi:hypothetical protein
MIGCFGILYSTWVYRIILDQSTLLGHFIAGYTISAHIKLLASADKFLKPCATPK